MGVNVLFGGVALPIKNGPAQGVPVLLLHRHHVLSIVFISLYRDLSSSLEVYEGTMLSIYPEMTSLSWEDISRNWLPIS